MPHCHTTPHHDQYSPSNNYHLPNNLIHQRTAPWYHRILLWMIP
ncbi:hypothetical protein ACHAWO_009338 [Cyclotella atomus]|uniref:Uncharacterized protein n=1 Tax=Cyclotella atomus TaxID=382360 RepID=A0ABD3P511_9STRA